MAAEEGQLVHVVVDAQVAFQVAREGERHRRIIPEHPGIGGLAADQAFDQVVLLGDHVLMGQAFRQDRHGDGHTLGPVADIHVRLGAGLEDRLFDDQHVVVLGGSAEEVLRTLPDEIPSKVREANKERLLGVGLERQTKGMRLRSQTLMHSAILKYSYVVTIGRKSQSGAMKTTTSVKRTGSQPRSQSNIQRS